MNVSEHLTEFVSRHLKCNHIFTLTGGGAMFLNDAFGNSPSLKAIYCHHEQAAAMAAVGYAKINSIGVCVTTTGCGATNALTGLLDAWQDNVPVLFISGQVKLRETSYLSSAHLRGFGIQEFNIIPVVQSFTKASYFIDSLDTYFRVLRTLQSDLFEGRPGPVWIDIPMDIQSKLISSDLKHDLDAELDISPGKQLSLKADDQSISLLGKFIAEAKRPVFLAGNGLRLSQQGDGISQLEKLALELSIPTVTTYLGADFFEANNPVYFGVVGIKAARIANLIVHNSDLLICIGTRLATSVIGFEYGKFAPKAKIIVIDIDGEEHKKATIKPKLIIKSDAVNALNSMASVLQGLDFSKWLSSCQAAYNLLPIQEQFSPEGSISIYDAVSSICKAAEPRDIVVSDAGSAYYVTSIMFRRYQAQRYITSGAQADMGFGVPAGIGCSFVACSNSRTHVLTGDGSFQLNIQELQTVANYRPNLSIYVLNNNGYLSIRATQKSFFPGRECGTDSTNGVSLPVIEKIALAYGIAHVKFDSQTALDSYLTSSKGMRGPIIIEIICPENELIIPRTVTVKDDQGQLMSASLGTMAPLLTQETVNELNSLGFALES